MKERDAQMAERWFAGESLAQIAAAYDCTVEDVERAIQKYVA